jgi:hypothetical protein
MSDIVRRIQAAAENMAGLVTMDKRHRYTVVATGKMIPGVTSVSGLVPKEWMAAWGAKEAVKFLGWSDFEDDVDRAYDMIERIGRIWHGEGPIDHYLDILKEAKGAFARKRDKALVDGKAGHAWIEEWINAQMKGSPPPDVPQGLLQRPIEQFLAWTKDNIKQWVLSEARVCNLTSGREYAGTLDAVAITVFDDHSLMDFKFADHLQPENALQLAGYKACFEPYDIMLGKRLVIRLPKTAEKQEWDATSHKYVMVPNDIEVKEIETDYEDDREAFYHALPFSAWVRRNKK